MQTSGDLNSIFSVDRYIILLVSILFQIGYTENKLEQHFQVKKSMTRCTVRFSSDCSIKVFVCSGSCYNIYLCVHACARTLVCVHACARTLVCVHTHECLCKVCVMCTYIPCSTVKAKRMICVNEQNN